MADDKKSIGVEPLRAFVTDIFAAKGFSDTHAATVAELLLWANLRGIDSHGIQRIPRYLEWVDEGTMNLKPDMGIEDKAPSCFVLDADRASGPVSMRAAMQHAIDLSDKQGIGMGVVRNTTHVAAIGYYTEMAAEADKVGICFSASHPLMAYHGARVAGIATNPISIAAPRSDGPPVLLDMATANIALGKIMHARNTDTPLPEGTALDEEGNFTTDPHKAKLPTPLGGPKGSGLSLMFEYVASLLAANPILSAFLLDEDKTRRHRQNGVVMAIDIAVFTDVDRFKKDAAKLAGAIKGLDPQPGVDDILLPGEYETGVAEKRIKAGIPVPPKLWDRLQEIAGDLDVDLPSGF